MRGWAPCEATERNKRPAFALFLREHLSLSSAHHPLLPLALPFSRETRSHPINTYWKIQELTYERRTSF